MSARTRTTAAWLLTMAAALGPAGAAPVKLRYVTAVYADAAGKPLQSPEGVACRAARLVVADTLGGRLVTFTVDGDTVTASGEIVLAQLPSPTRVRIDSKGDLVVLDGKLRRIARVSAAGAFTGYVDAPAGPSAFVPRGFALDRADALYTLDIAGGRVVVFDPAGKAVREIALPADRGSYSDIAVDGKGTLYVLDSVGRRVLAARKDQGAFAPLGSGFEGEADFPTSLVADDAGRLFVSDLDGGSILALGPDGKVLGRLSGPGWKPALLRAPSQLCLDGHGHLAVADRDNRRVQIFALSP